MQRPYFFVKTTEDKAGVSTSAFFCFLPNVALMIIAQYVLWVVLYTKLYELDVYFDCKKSIVNSISFLRASGLMSDNFLM